MADDGNVKVFCRVRPPNEREGGATPFTKKCVTVPSSDPLQQTVLLQLKGMGAHAAPKMFTFDRVFHELSSQNEVFELVGVPITRACLEGYNGTIFAYGQTGSGKTFTMQGPDDVIDADARSLTEHERGLRGLVPRVFDYLLQDAHSSGALRVPTEGTQVEHTFACSFMEIYNERVYDLLDHGSTRDSAGLTLRENSRKGVSVEGLIESVVTNAKQAAELMAVGARNRRVGQTAMNRESSRSHSVFVLQIQSKETTSDGLTRTRLSRFNLVDLAGSERQRNTEAAGERLKEAGSINKSLSALGNVIMGLVEQSAGKNRHVHYRDSKLTFLLKDSLGGNSKTFMIATVSPAEDSSHETLSTLKFAQRAKSIRNNAIINEDMSGSTLALQEEVMRLRKELQEARGGHNGGSDLLAESRLANQHIMNDEDASTDRFRSGLNERLEDLEASLAFALEKNEDLMRTNGRLSVRSGHMQALCSELKRNISSLRLCLRLRGNPEPDNIPEYQSSADAIEWRMKYEELEELHMELQDRVQATGLVDPSDCGETEKLNLMYQTLAKQLATVIREKHELSRCSTSKSIAQDDEEGKLARLESEIVNRAVEYESSLNSVLAINDAAEAKAEAASLELLQSKQKEAAWRIEQQKSHILIDQLQERVLQLEAAARGVQETLINERQQRVELEMCAMQEHNNRMQDIENKLAAKLTENYELSSSYEKLQSIFQGMCVERDNLTRQLQALELERVTKENENIGLLSIQKSNSALIEELTNKCTKFECDVADYIKRIADAKNEVSQLEQIRSDLSMNLEEAKKLFVKEQEQHRATESSLSTASESLVQERSNNEHLRNTIEDMKLQTKELNCRIGALEADLAKSVERLQAAEESIRSSQNELVERTNVYSNHLERLKAECVDLTAQQEKAKADSELVMLQLKELHRGKVEELNQSITRITEQRAVSQKQVHSLEETVAEQKELVRERDDEIVSRLEQIDNLQKQLDQLTGENESLLANLERAHQASVEAAQAHKTSLSNLQASHSTEISRLTSEHTTAIENLEKTLASLHAELEMKAQEVVQLTENVNFQQSRISAVELEVLSERQEKSVALTQLDQVKAILQDRETSLSEKVDDIARANRAIETLQEEVKEEKVRLSGRIQLLEADLKDINRAHDVLTSSHATLTKLQEVQTKETENWKQKKEEADLLIADLQRLVAQRDDELDEKDSVISGMEETVENLEADKQHATEALGRTEQSLEMTKKQLASANQLLKDTTAELSNTQCKLAKLEHEYQAATNENSVAQESLRQKISSLEDKREEERKAHEENKRSWEKSLADIEESLRIAELAKRTTADKLAAKLTELERCESALAASRAELNNSTSKLVIAEEEWQKSETSLTATIEELQQLVEDRQQLIRSLENDLSSARQELDHSNEKTTRQRKRNETLVEANAQLSLEIEERDMAVSKQQKAFAEMEEKLVESHEQQSKIEDELQQTKCELAAAKNNLARLEADNTQLSDELKAAKEDFKTKQAKWEAKDKEVQGRMTVVGEMEAQIADESKKLTEEKVLVAQRKKEAETIKREHGQFKARVQELETLKVQLSKEKERYRREVNILTIRLEQISKENDKLVGHDNKRQKIQHHIRVKEENNRLQSEVRLLTEEKLKLEVRIRKLEVLLKEKENLVNDAQAKFPRSPSSIKSSSSFRSTSHGVSSTGTSLTRKATESTSVESSARKRLRSLNDL